MAKKKKKKRSNLIMPLFVMIILLIALVSTVFTDWRQVTRNINNTKELHTKYDLLKEEEESLNVEITKLQDPDYIARYAREKYMYSKEGEVILRIIEDDDKEEKPKEDNKEENKDEKEE